MPAVMAPEIVTLVNFPSGGHRVSGLALQVILGGACDTPFMLVIVTPPVPEPGSTGKSLDVTATPPDVPLKVLFQLH